MLILTSLALVGCVPKGRYLELESQFEAARVAHAAAMADKEAEVAALQEEITGLRAEIQQQKEALVAREQRIASLQEKNAAMLKDRGAMAAEVSDMREALKELERRKAAADARLAEFRDLLDRFRSLIDAGTLQVKIKNGRMLVEMATDVLFASGSASLSAEGKDAITEVATILASIPNRSFQVEGHTDDDPIQTAAIPSNWYLASRRALNVVDHMLKAGMPADRISGASFGEHRPVVPNDSKENKARNRRIEIVVVPDLSQLPGYEELQAMQ
jgi:chemotaxis protein MotB